MTRLFSRNSNNVYRLLDDSDRCLDDDVPLDLVDDDDSCIFNNEVSGQETRLNCSPALHCPRVNWANSPISCLSNPKHRKTTLDVILSLFVLISTLSVSLSLGYYTVFVLKPSPVIDKSYQAFKIPNHEASLHYDAFQNAKKNHTSFSEVKLSNLRWAYQGRRSNREVVRLLRGKMNGNGDNAKNHEQLKKRRRRSYFPSTPLQYHPQWKMQVVFLVREGENIFTRENLETVHEIEKKIISHNQYPDFCFKDFHPNINNDPAVKSYNGCAPLNSLLTYFYPSKDGKGNIFYDGLGENIDNIKSALKLAMTSTHFYYYVDDKVNTSYLKSQLLRTEVLFGAPLKGFVSPFADRDQQSKRYKDFVITYIDELSKASTDDLQVLYGGEEIFDYEVESTFWNDVKLAVYALIAIILLMLVLTSGSLWLTIWGIISILLSIPLSIFIYRYIFNVIGLGILNGAAAFVIIGIGVDDVFVFINVFRQATHLKDARARTWYTICTAGKATFFTSFTTASAFAANIASMIPAVHDFGLFMSLVVAMCWVTVMLVLPPALYIWYISLRPCEERVNAFLVSCLPGCKSSCSLKVPDDIAQFMDVGHSSLTPMTLTREITDEDADVPMLSMDRPIQYYSGSSDSDDGEDDNDEALLDPDPLTLPEEPSERKYLGAQLQGLLYHGLALPFIRARWFILGISAVLLCISVGLMTQLRTSSKPPQFFKEDTNMQQLLDLKSRFGAIDNIECYDCSAIYSIGQHEEPIPTAPTHTDVKPMVKLPVTSSAKNSTQEKFASIPTLRIPSVKPSTKSPVLPEWPFLTVKPTSSHHDKTKKQDSQIKPTDSNVTPPKSAPEDYDVCKERDCSNPKDRPLLESGATVYVVLGIKDFKLSHTDIGHVMSGNTGSVEFDPRFASMMNMSSPQVLDGLREICKLCKRIASNTHLVRNGSAQCLPMDAIDYTVKEIVIGAVEECRDLPKVGYIFGNQQPAHAIGGLTADATAVLWLGFAFESTTSKSKSYFEAYREYQMWEDFLSEVKEDLDPNSPLQNMFQTSEFWPEFCKHLLSRIYIKDSMQNSPIFLTTFEVLMEVVAVDSAIYGVVLSLVICMIAVTLFTRHVLLLLIISISIVEMVCLVVSIFYIVGWEIGGVEAISLSILVGSSVDYCVHLVEGYILAADACPIKDNPTKARHWRTAAAFSHIGVSIISSALTTVIAAIPLTRTTIQPFSKFGQIIAINTTVCIVYSLTVCTALLSVLAPGYFKPSFKSTVKAIIGTALIVGLAILGMFAISKIGVDIPGPNGGTLFH